MPIQRGAAAGDDTEDASTEFTDSIEEEATHHNHQQLVKVALEKSLATVETQNPSFSPLPRWEGTVTSVFRKKYST
ncbi:PREDICTED: myomegalin-like [Cercocebus atys]|uniref:myomegalin-like n=1 Tax=Cercocebus atys TaxID=9531 RepID=UPI0005F40D2A|nr:PREDICTED: myomegalin-like [Cercocebus atys]